MPPALSANGDTGGKCRTGVYNILRAQALHYRFKPGQHLPIAVIARLLKVSNTPVREALMRLYAEGLVDAVPARGFFARELRLREIAEYNIMLDVMVCRCLESVDMTLCVGPKDDTDDALSKIRQGRRLCAYDLAISVEKLFETIVSATGEKTIAVHIRRLCEKTHHIRLHAFESRRIGSRLRRALAGLLEALNRQDRPMALEKCAEFSRLFADALPHLVNHALGVAYATELTDIANWVVPDDRDG
ncbi:GntR family transcriptional regulator [Labrys neptuniae]